MTMCQTNSQFQRI